MPDNIELEKAALDLCTHCREAKRWIDAGKKGHRLRLREDTCEWVHDFVEDSKFRHAFCYATKLRQSA